MRFGSPSVRGSLIQILVEMYAFIHFYSLNKDYLSPKKLKKSKIWFNGIIFYPWELIIKFSYIHICTYAYLVIICNMYSNRTFSKKWDVFIWIREKKMQKMFFIKQLKRKNMCIFWIGGPFLSCHVSKPHISKNSYL